ncbi:hypothetical protein Pmar_PMAR025714 [Perkinsus marinus ATCC 50983]|uniref:Uncharacterized protein n=1 Tax=Perkinsus marinus (strain ATCC 50983 / TXsc) TaxID=423536 RepID=C5LQK5_PERM5|nr:hypothetical protein Pmar_PMAR025714 [Perkinsus marinus ATCC 50983]EER00990.1 hypothetical protein Pmar_PMAR025714 [Perkinsus marinus ATCC 50983]|eukprot:XP_002768272.1 hypothetical protein Pmar_PMAR025714 [Perkinsus marinus ATCC 50983]
MKISVIDRAFRESFKCIEKIPMDRYDQKSLRASNLPSSARHFGSSGALTRVQLWHLRGLVPISITQFRPILFDPDCLAMILPAGEHSLHLGRPESMIKIVNSDPVLFTMTLESEQCSSRSSSSKRVNSSGPVEGFKSFYASVTGRDEIRAPE